jgi:hypothetical protein
MQDYHPIVFVSKALGPRMRSLSTYEKKYVAIFLVIEQWRCYLKFKEFYIYTDQKSVTFM